jgi:hypothetical protein
MVAEVDAAGSDGQGSKAQGDHDQYTEEYGGVGVGAGGSLAVTEKEEEGKVDREEGHVLGMGGWHAVTLTRHHCLFHVSARIDDPVVRILTLRSLFLDQAFENEVQSFTGHLSDEHQDHLHLSSRPDQGHIGDS